MITLSNSATWQAKKNYSLGNYTIVESGNGYIVLHTNILPTDSTPLRITFIPKEYEISYITFQVDGNTYTAIQGMTWREWVNSSFNTDGWIWEDQYGVCQITSQDGDSREGVCIEISPQNGKISGGLYTLLAWGEWGSGGIYT